MKRITPIPFIIALLWCCLSANLFAQKTISLPKPKTGTSKSGSSKSSSSLSSNKPKSFDEVENNPKKKKVTKSTPLGRAFQDMTARYNRYFNAKMKYDESNKMLVSKHKEDFNTTLPVYALKGGDGKMVSFNLDEINKKASINIQKKPNSKWVDDSYLLLGQAFYLMGDYESAVKSFKYINNRFANNIRMSYDTKSKEQMQKLRAEEQKQVKKDREYDRKLKEQERQDKIEQEQKKRDAAKKETEKAKKERLDKAADAKKDREKDAKERAKERAKEIKEREKAREQDKKQREKDKKAREKARKQGKPLPPKTTTTNAKDKEAELKLEKEAKAQEKAAKEAEEKAKEEKEAQEKAAKEAEEKAKEEKEAEELAAKSVVQERSGKEKGYKGGFLRHTLAKHDAMLWLTRTYIETDKMDNAASLIKKMKDDKRFPNRKKGDLGVVEAYYYLQNKQNNQAQVALRSAAGDVKPKAERARLYYILGQLAQEDDNHKQAVKDFEKVLHSKPVFDMELNARINIAKSKMQGGEFTPEKAIAYLTKMSKEEKNVDNVDQIYFAMAEIELQNGNTDKANEYLAQSAEKSTNNKDQKVKAFLKLAEMNYKAEKYLPASGYYDSTFALIAKTDAKYKEVSERKSVLGELARDLKTIALQDSLQRIAQMPDKERKEFLQNLIAQLRKDAAAKDTTGMAEVNKTKMSDSKGSSGVSYFYNDAAKLNGYKDFALKWGNRPLTDDWRLAAKQNNATTTDNSNSNVDTTGYDYNKLIEMASKGELSVDAIMQKLPITAKQKAQSDSLLIDAYYGAGKTYKESLKNNKKATETFAKLMERYPNNKYAPDALYALYQLSTTDKKTADANRYKNELIEKYPNSKYAQILRDPNYLATLNAQKSALEKYYNDTYALYQQDQFEEVKKRSSEVNTQFIENPLQPKFDLLNAFVTGKTENKAAYVSSLKTIVTKYPTDEVKAKAQEILTYLENSANAAAATDAAAKNKKFKYEPNTKHYLIIAFEQYSKQINNATTGLSNFNSASFSSDGLKTNQMLLDPQHQIITIKEFANADKAKLYYETLLSQKDAAINVTDVSYKVFYISKTNFNQYFKDKDTAAYFEYFTDVYSGSKK